MNRTVYVDVLFCLNFVVDYLVLLSVQKFLRLSARRWRILCGAAVGALSSFVIFLPPMPSFFSCIINFLTAGGIVACAFAPIRPIVFLKSAITFFTVGFCFCGVCIGLWLIFYPENMLIRNGAVYVDISPFLLLLSTLVCYIVMRIFVRISGRDMCHVKTCSVTVTLHGVEKTFAGTVDTGNTLREPFSDEAVIVVRRELFEELVPLHMLASGESGETTNWHFRLIPYKSIGGSGMIPSIKPEHITITIDKKKTDVCAYLAFCESDKFPDTVQSLVPAEIISKEC